MRRYQRNTENKNGEERGGLRRKKFKKNHSKIFGWKKEGPEKGAWCAREVEGGDNKERGIKFAPQKGT